MKIERQLDAEDTRCTNRHVRITGEVEIQLEGISEHSFPGLYEADIPTIGRVREDRRCNERDVVRQHNLLEEPDEEDRKANHQVHAIEGKTALELCLRKYLFVMDDRSRNELREKHHKKTVLKERMRLDVSTPRIH